MVGDRQPNPLAVAFDAQAMGGVAPVALVDQAQAMLTAVAVEMPLAGDQVFPDARLAAVEPGRHLIEHGLVAGLCQIALERRRHPHRLIGIVLIGERAACRPPRTADIGRSCRRAAWPRAGWCEPAAHRGQPRPAYPACSLGTHDYKDASTAP